MRLGCGARAREACKHEPYGMLLFGPYVRITCCVIAGVAAMVFVVYPAVLAAFCRENPYRILLKMRDAMLTAFVTRSSAATLPVSFRVMDRLGVDRSLSSFSLPMGATVNMDGVCVHLPGTTCAPTWWRGRTV